jgi:2-oxoglutarate ferredoxin oxidoreductase subunit delta
MKKNMKRGFSKSGTPLPFLSYFCYDSILKDEEEKKRKMAKKGNVEIDRERCKGCYLCVRACPIKVLEKDAEPNLSGIYPAVPAQKEKNCIACGNCYAVCPDVCLTVWEEAV